MASESFFEERSDTVKMSETPYPANGSGENLVEVARFKYSNLCTQTCPYRLAGSALPGQRRSVSLRFRVAMRLKTQFACHWVQGKLTLREKEFIVFIKILTVKWIHKRKNTNWKLSPLVGESVSGADERGKCEQAQKSDSDLCTFAFSGTIDTKEKFIFPLLPAVKVHIKTPPFCESGVIFYAMSRFFRILFNTPWNIFMSVSETPA